jgi:hypothetical protein
LPLLVLLGLLAAPARGQFVLTGSEELDFDRPEAWAMAWFSAVTLPNGIGGPSGLEAGQLEVAFEGGWVPTLSEDQRRVGFTGNKVEDLNRTSAVGRPTVTVGLPRGWALEGGWMPPLEVDGVAPNLLSLAVAKSLWRGERLHLAARALVEDGSIRGDLTCSADDVASGPDTSSPVFIDCEEPSDDELEMTLYGAELQVSSRLTSVPSLSPYAALGWTHLDAEFRIDARYNGIIDRSSLLTEGSYWTVSAGLAWEARPGWRLAGELFYAPLDVVRSFGAESETDALLNVRAMLSYRVR